MKKLLICAMALLCVLPLSAKKRQVAIVAHRGYWQCEAGGNSHNSIASLKAAQAGKFWGSEFDVNMTKDGELMVFHDDAVAGKTFISKRRQMYAYYLLYKHDPQSAEKEYQAAMKLKDTYPIEGEILSELKLLDVVKKHAANNH